MKQIHRNNLLQNKNVVITGGASGIGYEIAKEVIDLGGRVLITGKDEGKLIEKGKKLKCDILQWDISNINISKEKVKEVLRILNDQVDCFVNNAGIYKNIQYNNCNLDDYSKIMNTNLNGLYFATKEIIDQCFKKNKNGNIIMITSIEGIRGEDSPYGISKACVNHFTNVLSKQLLKDNIRVNAIAPGMTCSNINLIDDNSNLYRESLKGKRILSAKEVADIAIFLMSDYSKCINGQVICCDNGETLL